MEIVPIDDYVVLKPFEEKDVTESGLILPSGRDAESVNNGVVVAMGELVKNIPIESKVLFKPYGFDEVTIEKQKYLVGKAENIMAIIT